MKLLSKYFLLLGIGGMIYIGIEFMWRGYSHWSMFFVGGACFVCIGLINEILPWTMPLWLQVIIGVCIITILEFLAGCILNIWLGWNVWDYSGLPGNLLGQICPQYIVLWVPLCLIGIIFDDWLRYWWFGEDKPHYKLV
jgi:uncharacterized membrane protein